MQFSSTLVHHTVSGADSIGHGGPPLLQMAGHGGTVSRRTANKKLTKLYWPTRKRWPQRLIILLEPKKWRDTTKKSGALSWIGGPPHFRAGPVPPVSNSFRRHCTLPSRYSRL